MAHRVIEGRYEVQRELGAGGMGKVYLGVHTGTGRPIAVKEIISKDAELSETAIKRFMREARTAGTINTKHIVEIIDVGTDPATGRPYMVMELLQGEDAKQLLGRVGQVAPKAALALAAQACVGLQKAHEANVIHRDIKPANLFLNSGDADEITVKLLDFGVAKIKKEHLHEGGTEEITRTGALLGSPLYMAPEQARGMRDVDHRADLWSLGVVLYRLLGGQAPFQNSDNLGDLIVSICSSQTPPLQDLAPWIEPEVAAVVHACLVVDRDRRFQSAADMRAALVKLCGSTSLTKEMLVSVTDTEREQVATRFDTSSSGADGVMQWTQREAETRAPEIASASTVDSTAAPTAAPARKRTRSLGLVLAVGVGALVGAYGVHVLLRSSQADVAQTAATSSALAASSAPANGDPGAVASAATTTIPTASASAASPIDGEAVWDPERQLSVPPSPTAEAGIRALKTVALADGDMHELEAQLIESARLHALRTSSDVGTLEPIRGSELKGIVPTGEFRERVLLGATMVASIDGGISDAEQTIIDEYRAAFDGKGSPSLGPKRPPPPRPSTPKPRNDALDAFGGRK